MASFRQRRLWTVVIPLSVLAVLAAVSTHRSTLHKAIAYVPKADDEVVETLPGPVTGERPRPAAAGEPHVATDDAPTAAAQAREQISLYRRTADPRYLGRAEAALGAFWELPAPPEPILVLRATIRQSNHEFGPALSDLDLALTTAPDDSQALLDRASIRTVLGRYPEALDDCRALAPLTARIYDTMCRAAVMGVTGAASLAYDQLSNLLAGHDVDPDDRCWVESVMGELSTRVGNDANAEKHLRAVVEKCPSDTYSRGVLADLYIDSNRYHEAMGLLRDQTSQDAQLLRLAIAERRAHAPGFEVHVQQLTQRFEEARVRGNQVHRREQARFELELKAAPDRALDLALANFEVQREPADARIALEAALAAGRPERVQNVIAFVVASRLEDPTIRTLITRLPR